MPQYWNREKFAADKTRSAQDSSNKSIVNEARIVSLAMKDDPSNVPLENLPEGATVLAVGSTIDELDIPTLQQQKANVIFVSPGPSKETLAKLIQELDSSLEWIHSRSAGVDAIYTDTLANTPATVTNAKGAFSSTLAEYTLLACSYFAKDLPHLLKNKGRKDWNKYNILELRNATLGIVGYGDIGQAAAKLAKAYGMRVIALRRNPEKTKDDPYCDVVYGNDQLNVLFGESDYILCSAPLTAETKGMIGKEQFDAAKTNAVFINVGRGPIVDEEALVEALKDGRLKGAGLDVFATEPLPKESELWELDNVLLSPHNMDATETFMLESTKFFVNENLPRFLHGELLLNEIDKAAGY
ncbi:D-isomer specific 2-hydroxyacid dehydrogenase [Nitzschia inconspicua]|uniref:D-isomer specific 2-hydroxyacid dehydrogenase n=1 Tax=Nitzschia inconspicua TaxID=303405 RepID=A0A9K3P991_9STRA|nr:D-isomer specific 2-hydroxyacid dehydrogenase [Nitzschia inconspicua]